MKKVVIFTSYPGRISRVANLIKSQFLSQTSIPDIIDIGLYEDEFPNKTLPNDLNELIKSGIVNITWIKYSDTIGKNKCGFKKLFVAYKYRNEENTLLFYTDDDVIYEKNYIECVENVARKYPNAFYNVFGRFPKNKNLRIIGWGCQFYSNLIKDDMLDLARLCMDKLADEDQFLQYYLNKYNTKYYLMNVAYNLIKVDDVESSINVQRDCIDDENFCNKVFPDFNKNIYEENISSFELYNLDCKILINLYKANDCLKIQYRLLEIFGLLKDTIFVENSPEDYTDNRNFLDYTNTPYIKNYGSSHAKGLELMLPKIDNSYILILDQDCFLKNNPSQLIKLLIDNYKADLFGDVNLCRGFQKLKPRICPWFCLVNNKFLKDKNIKYTNWDKVKLTNSETYYTLNDSYNKEEYKNIHKYDVGATLFEEMYENGAYVTSFGDLNLEPSKFYIHIEGSSWQKEPSHREFNQFYSINKQPIIDSLKKQLNIV